MLLTSPEIVAILRRVLFLSFSDCEDFVYELYLLNFPTSVSHKVFNQGKEGAKDWG